MGIGFVIMFWFVDFVVAAFVYLFLYSLAKDNEGAADLKKAFLALTAIGSFAVITLFAFAIGNVCLDYFLSKQNFHEKFRFRADGGRSHN